MKKQYGKFEFCKAVGCNEWKKEKSKRLCATECDQSAYRLHDYLTDRGYKIEREVKEPERGNSFGIPWSEGGFD